MKKRKISDAVVRRLPRYYRYLDDLHSKGIVRISSSSLGERMGITASQIRQDLSCFGEFGQQGYGYNILELRTEIGHILGVDEQHRLVVVGAGHLGHALLRNFDFMQTGFLLDTAFDVSPTLIGTRVNNVLIRSFDEIGDYFAACHPDVAVLTVPKHIAQEVAEQLVALGVRGIWNFTNTELHVGSEVFTEDVHFADSLLALIGQWLAVLFKPLGFGDWRCATALISGFIAKESVVSTLQVLLGSAAITSLFTTRSAVSFLVFTLLYTPCVAAVATIRRELGSRIKTVGVVLMQCGVAWLASYIAFAIGGLLA